jgi:hypothetical protein
MRLAGAPDENGKLVLRSNNAVRLELALLSHLLTVAIKEWGIRLPFNPVANIRQPAPGAGRNRRLTPAESKRLLAASGCVLESDVQLDRGGSRWRPACGCRRSVA